MVAYWLLCSIFLSNLLLGRTVSCFMFGLGFDLLLGRLIFAWLVLYSLPNNCLVGLLIVVLDKGKLIEDLNF